MRHLRHTGRSPRGCGGRIESGEFAAHDRIPSETDIMGETGVARSTARRAVALLREQGVVYTVAGRGSYAGASPQG
jgi:GntR family transcriptional regulator